MLVKTYQVSVIDTKELLKSGNVLSLNKKGGYFVTLQNTDSMVSVENISIDNTRYIINPVIIVGDFDNLKGLKRADMKTLYNPNIKDKNIPCKVDGINVVIKEVIENNGVESYVCTTDNLLLVYTLQN